MNMFYKWLRHPIARWCFGLTLPALCFLSFTALLLWAETRSDWIAKRAGVWLLTHNNERPQIGATWQSIIASRHARSHLDSSTIPAINPSALKKHVLEYRYVQLQHTPHFSRWRTIKRHSELDAQQLSGQQLRQLAQSMQTFSQVDRLLKNMQLPTDGYNVHARIRAQVHLADGSLFTTLHKRLRSIQAPEAWNFIRMAPSEQSYWQQSLALLLDSPVEHWEQVLPEMSAVHIALLHILADWSDSLRADEKQRVVDAWRQMPDFELRIARNMDRFDGYALLPDELPVRFVLPKSIGESAVDPVQ